MKIRAAIIGCGHIAGGYDEAKTNGGCYTHAGAYRLCPEVDLVTAVDPNSDRLTAFGKYWGVMHLYANTMELLRHYQVEIVSVCVPEATMRTLGAII